VKTRERLDNYEQQHMTMVVQSYHVSDYS